MTNPAATTYHHQRWPFSIRRSSEISIGMKRERDVWRAKGVRWTAPIEGTAAFSGRASSPVLGCEALGGSGERLRHDRAGSKRWKKREAASASPTATATQSRRISKTWAVQSMPFQGKVRIARSPPIVRLKLKLSGPVGSIARKLLRALR